MTLRARFVIACLFEESELDIESAAVVSFISKLVPATLSSGVSGNTTLVEFEGTRARSRKRRLLRSKPPAHHPFYFQAPIIVDFEASEFENLYLSTTSVALL